MTKVKNQYGIEVSMDAAVELMDEEIRQELADSLEYDNEAAKISR